MTKKKTAVKPEPDILTSAAQKIGSTLGSLAAKVGLGQPAAPKRKAPVKKTKQTAAKKKAAPARRKKVK